MNLNINKMNWRKISFNFSKLQNFDWDVKRLVLIDDDDDDRTLFEDVLTDLRPDIVLELYDSALGLLDKIILKIPNLIFVDLNMPVVNGFDFLYEVRSNKVLCNVPVIILSTSADKNDIKRAMDLGADRFITKPTSYIELKQLFSKAIDEFMI